MPTYQHECQNKECNHEWEDFYSMSKDPPTTCPKCLQETAKRVLTPTGGGRVTLYGDELIASVKQGAEKMKKDIYGSEKNYSNVLGEDRYNKIQTSLDRNKK